MASNYKNSAGTDLDSLFSVNNSNAGAVGFKTSDGTDLGNRYSNSSTLQQTIGYKNNAGTDIGYLRGKVATIGSNYSISNSLYKAENDSGRSGQDNCNCGWETDGESSHYSCQSYKIQWRAYIAKWIISASAGFTKATIDVYMAPKSKNAANIWIGIARESDGNTYYPAWNSLVSTNCAYKTGMPACAGYDDGERNAVKIATITKTFSSLTTSATIYIAYTGGARWGENHFIARGKLTLSNAAGNSTTSGLTQLGDSWNKGYW